MTFYIVNGLVYLVKKRIVFGVTSIIGFLPKTRILFFNEEDNS